ncbi:hypothetical protein GCAAIG_09245 [Candidatus Electronema halotolerans]
MTARQEVNTPPSKQNLAAGEITAATALRLARYFDMSPQFWLGLQMDFELDPTKKAAAPATGSLPLFCSEAAWAYIMPMPPPMPPMPPPMPPGGMPQLSPSFSGSSAIMHSVVSSIPDTEAAF